MANGKNGKGKNGNEKLKIGFLASYPPQTGGVTTIATRMASYLSKMGHETHFVGYDFFENTPELESEGLRLHTIDRMGFPNLPNADDQPYTWLLASKLHEVHKNVGLDIVHAHFAIPFALSTYLAQQSSRAEGRGFPYVVTGHGTDIHTYGDHEDINPMMRLALENADAVTYVGKSLLEKAEFPQEMGGLGIRKRGKVIENFVETDIFYPEKTNLRQKLRIPEEAFVIGHVSNFSAIKQTDYLFRLAENLSLRGELDDTYFLLVGYGQKKDELERKVHAAGYADHFKFLGDLDAVGVRQALSAMDFSSLFSKREGGSPPLVILESCACGTPVIGTNVDGINSFIENGVNGFLFNQEYVSQDVFSDDIQDRDVNRFAEIVQKAKRMDSGLVDKMNLRAFNYVVANRSIDTVMRKYMDVYRSAINEYTLYRDIPEMVSQPVTI